MRLLLIDDDAVDRQMVVRLLRDTRPRVIIEQAVTGLAGLHRFKQDVFDAVLLDFRLPDMTGLEVLEQLLSHTARRAGVIMLTGAADSVLELACLEAGAQDFLLKHDISERDLERALLHAQARHKLGAKLIESHEQLRVLAESDPLTRLSNRYFFDKSLGSALSRAHRRGETLALMLLDLDHFKTVNDTLGHDVGDLLLREVAARLLRTTRESDVVCRLGGDEFAILTSEVTGETSMARLAHRVLDAMRAPMRLGGHDLAISGSIGIATAPECGETAEIFMKSADLALYQAKRDGRNGFQFFSAALQRSVDRKAAIERGLRSQHIGEQLVLLYQPLFCADTGRICGAEALIRWRHPEHGLLSPAEFLDVAAECGLMPMIDSWTRRAATTQGAIWLSQGLVAENFVLACNVSVYSLLRDDVDGAVTADLRQAGLAAPHLELEVLVGSLTAQLDHAAAALLRISRCGVGISIDNFGIGAASIANFRRIRANTLKVDRSFLAGVPDHDADRKWLRAVVALAKTLGLKVVVQGVENADHARLARECGADVLQGFGLSHALSAADFEARLRVGTGGLAAIAR